VPPWFSGYLFLMLTRSAFISILLTISVIGDALAQARTVNDAAALYQRGAEEYVRGNYVAALSLFQQGYDLEPNGMFLYNISLVYGKMDNYVEALRYAERAENTGLPPEASARNLPRVAAYRVILNARDQIDSEETPVCPKSCGDGKACDLETGLCVDVAETPLVGASSAKPTWLGWSGLGVTLVGAAFITVALLQDASLANELAEYDRLVNSGEGEAARAKKAEIEDAQFIGKGFLYAGSAFAALGVGLFIFDLVRDTEPIYSIGPVFHQDGGGIRVQGAF